jgi:hypothetical protein
LSKTQQEQQQQKRTNSKGKTTETEEIILIPLKAGPTENIYKTNKKR